MNAAFDEARIAKLYRRVPAAQVARSGWFRGAAG